MESVRTAERAPGLGRRVSGRVAERARANIEPQGAPVPLDVAAITAPFRKYRGLSIRVEHLAHGAKLSKGRNNGDRSYSLSPDDLDGLEYLPPSRTYDAHTLGVRVISLDGGDAETLAVLDLPIAAVLAAPVAEVAPKLAPAEEVVPASVPNVTAPPEVVPRPVPAAPIAESPRSDTSARQNELARLRESLAARETELAEAQRLAAEAQLRAAEAERTRRTLESERSAAESTAMRALQQRLAQAEADARAQLEQSRSAWEAEQATRAARSGQSAKQAVEEARKQWRQESDAALAELSSRAERAEAALVQARAQVVIKSDDTELRRLREQLSSTQANLAARGAELAEARATAELAQDRARQAAADLTKAEQGWKAGEAKRFNAAESGWREQTAKAVAEATARLDQAQAGHAEARAQSEARLHQLNVAQASLAVRDAELARMREAAEQARAHSSGEAEQSREHWQREMQAALAAAQESWKTAEAARLAAAETQWKSQMAPALAETTARLKEVEAALAEARAETERQRNHGEEELRRLRDQLTSTETSLAARETELAQARLVAEHSQATVEQSVEGVSAAVEKARQKWQRDADAALAKAEQTWKAGEGARLADVEERYQTQFGVSLNEAQSRAEHAEQMVAELRALAEGLRHELADVQATVANREVEIGEARALLEQERERLKQVPVSSQERKPAWKTALEDRNIALRRKLVRNLSVAACLACIAVLLFPHVQPAVSGAWPQGALLGNNLLQMAGLSDRFGFTPAPAPVATAEPHATVNVRMANLRANPSTGAAVVTRLARDLEVTPVERRGSWVFVRVGEGANAQQGWLSSAVLKDVAASASVQ